MDLTTFEIIMVIIAVLEGGIFIGGLTVSIKFLTKRLDDLEKSQAKSLKEYKEESEKNIKILRDDMKKYNNVLERLARGEQDISTLKHDAEVLHKLYNSALDRIISCPHYNKPTQ